jgi:hypothetical protein
VSQHVSYHRAADRCSVRDSGDADRPGTERVVRRVDGRSDASRAEREIGSLP